jgi:membrane-bound serine protease (ClpP class)
MFWVWAILLLVLGLGLAVMEIFFPSAGILGFLAAAAILAAVIVGFQEGPLTGGTILVVALFGVPAVVALGFKLWPKTAMGRRILLLAPHGDDVTPDPDHRATLRSYVGQVGRAKCKMLPGGAVTIEGRTVDAVSEGVPIEAGDPVRVIQVRGNRLVVRRLEDDEPSPTADDPLRRPIDALLPDPFDDRPA